MSKQKKPGRRTPAVTSQQKPYMFNLPGDLRTVQVYAFALAYECAYLVIRDKKDFEQTSVDVMTLGACSKIENAVIEGKRGTNDPELYRKTFIESFAVLYPRARQKYLAGEWTVNPAWTDEQRASVFLTTAEQVIAPAEQ